MKISGFGLENYDQKPWGILPSSRKIGAKIRQQVAVAQSV
jgi:hypothetical protein